MFTMQWRRFHLILCLSKPSFFFRSPVNSNIKKHIILRTERFTFSLSSPVLIVQAICMFERIFRKAIHQHVAKKRVYELAHIVEIYYQLVGSMRHTEFSSIVVETRAKHWCRRRQHKHKKTNRFRKFITTLFIDMEIIYGLDFVIVTKRLAKYAARRIKPFGQWNDVKRIKSTQFILFLSLLNATRKYIRKLFKFLIFKSS